MLRCVGAMMILAVGVACGGPHDATPAAQGNDLVEQTESNGITIEPAPEPEPLTEFPGFLSEGDPAADAYRRPATAATTELSRERVAELLARLDPLPTEIEDVQDFARRPDSEPPPRTGELRRAEFPPPDERERPALPVPDGNLRLLRFSPSGEVPVAGQISLTFDRPMVAVTAHDDSIADGVPVTLDPEPAGNWRWVGTRTLMFEPDAARLPMATRFNVTLKPGVQALDGTRLDDPVEWSFATPPVTLMESYPAGSGAMFEPVMILAFDQRVSLEALSDSLKILGPDGESLAWRAATDEEIAADAGAVSITARLEPGRWVALRPAEPLPNSATIELVLRAGAPSAEGPLETASDQRREFRTYGPMQVVDKRCGWQYGCTPADSFAFTLSNELDDDTDLADMVRVEPEIPGMQLEGFGRHLAITGLKRGQTSYTVLFSDELTDQFDQRISGSREFSFEVGSYPPGLMMGADILTTLDPAGPPQLDFFSTNYRSAEVRIHRVEPGDWSAYVESYREKWDWQGEWPWPELPGEKVHEGPIEIEPRRDEALRTAIDLAPWLDESSGGHLLVALRPGELVAGVSGPRQAQTYLTWVQATDIGIDAAMDQRDLLVWVTDLGSGEALIDAEVRLGIVAGHWQTDDEGLVRIPLPEWSELTGIGHWISASSGDDIALLPESNYWSRRSGWYRREVGDELVWQVFDDRQVYRPGEQVHLKGWIRRLERRPDGGLGLPDGSPEIDYSVVDARGHVLHEGQTRLAGLGGFELAFDLPSTPDLGAAQVRFTFRSGGEKSRLSNTSHVHTFQIQEFRTPEFEVGTRVGAGPFVGAEPIEVEVNAAYYAGGALPGAPTRWRVEARGGHFAPPNQDDWSFGFQYPWWMPGRWQSSGGSASAQFEGLTDAGGRHLLSINPDFEGQPRPLLIKARATVTDVNRQAWTSASELLVHPAEVYVGLKTDSYFVDRGEPLVVDLVSVNLNGEVVPDRSVVVEMSRVRHRWRSGQLKSAVEDTERCRLTTDVDGLGQCRFETAVGGQYQLTATISDESGRPNASRIVRWVSGGRTPTVDRVEVEQVLLIPDRDEYAPGEVARLLIQAPFEQAEGLLTLRRHGLAEQRRFKVRDGSATLDIELRHDWLPNVQAHVTLIGSTPRSGPDEVEPELPPRPAIAVGTHELSLSNAERALEVEITPTASSLAPGEQTSIDLLVRNVEGHPVANAELALIVVDEAILALSDYYITDPLEVFYRPRPPEVQDLHLRPTVHLSGQADLRAYLAGGDVGGGEIVTGVGFALQERSAAMAMPSPPPGVASADPIAVREDFNPLAAFVPTLVTDDQGRASARFQMPDNLTRYRVTVVAVGSAKRYGKAESTLTARLPLMLRPSPPRFLNFGDQFDFAVVLQNQTDQTLAVDLAMAASNLKLTGAHGLRVEVPPNDRVEARFPAAADQAGTSRYQVAASTEGFADAARGQFPVWTPATSEAFATYGVIDEGSMVQPVVMPTEVWPQFGQLELTTSSTALQSLTDAYVYLHDYPFACSEQIASRMIATAALRDVLQAFQAADFPTEEAIARTMAADLERLTGLQNDDGGFGLWRRGRDGWPYATVHVAHALVRARLKGYEVEGRLFDRTLAHVAEIERHMPTDYPDWTRRHIVAYSLYVRALHGDRDRTRARGLLSEVDSLDQLSFESIGWLLGVLTGHETDAAEVRELRRFLANRVTETAASASFASGWKDGAHLIMHSSRRADGVILEALIADQPESDLIPKLVHGLQAHRTRGRWANTQENSFVLLALDSYFRTFEGIEPDFVARTWLDEEFAAEHAFRGRTTERHHLEIPMRRLATGSGRHDLVLDKDGAGRLYYRVGLAYAPQSLELAASDHGFEVQRSYQAVDDEDDVHLGSDGVWQIRAGARVKVELSLVAPARRYHVALIDPLPAGLEPINPALRVSDVPDGDDGVRPMGRGLGFYRWWGPWYDHQNLRDERVEAFAALLPGGVYSYVYYARATTLGEFVVPPARAEEMYQPETFGRSASAVVTVVD